MSDETKGQDVAAEDDGSVKMSALFSALAKFEEDPTDANSAEYNALLARLSVCAYRPLGDKAASVVQIANSITADNMLDYVFDLQLATFAYGLLPYATNLVDDISGKPVLGEDGKPRVVDGKPLLASLMDPSIYDLADRIGMTDYIKAYCAADYAELLHMADSALNFRDIERMERFAEGISPEKMESTIKSIREFKGLLTPDELKSLASIASAADPAWAAAKEAIADKAAEAAMEKASVESRPESERAAGAEAVKAYEAAKAAQAADKPEKA
jgi:hypothetical protein